MPKIKSAISSSVKTAEISVTKEFNPSALESSPAVFESVTPRDAIKPFKVSSTSSSVASAPQKDSLIISYRLICSPEAKAAATSTVDDKSLHIAPYNNSSIFTIKAFRAAKSICSIVYFAITITYLK